MFLAPFIVGRKKIKIGYIEDNNFRKISYCKRKKGLLKKAMELSLLSGHEVLLIIHNRTTDRTILYNSMGTTIDLFTDILTKGKFDRVCSNEDVRNHNELSIMICLRRKEEKVVRKTKGKGN